VGEALLGGDLAVLGEPGLLSLETSRVQDALPAFLLACPWAPPAEVSRQLTSRWTEYLAADAVRAREVLRTPDALRGRVLAARELAFPLAEVSLNIDGLTNEYAALARHSAARPQWEEQQVREGPPVLVVREGLGAGRATHG
jgi:hypothetical protein